MDEFDKLIKEDAGLVSGCNLCKESSYEIGKNTGYGALIYKKNGWFATLSPKTGGDPEHDFTIQLMPTAHLTQFSQVGLHDGLAESYGVAFAKLSGAMTAVLMKDDGLKSVAEDKKESVPVGTYGKSTSWKQKKEHLHIKIFPFRGNIGQPYTVDTSFGGKKIHKDSEGEFVKMEPVRKVMIDKERFKKLSTDLISLLQ